MSATKLMKLDARVLAVLHAHLPEFLAEVNSLLPSDYQIPFPAIYVNQDMISLENLNGVDTYPVLSVYPSGASNVLDITDSSTQRSFWIVEAALFSYAGDASFPARQAQYLSAAAAECLETYLPSSGDPCIYDTQIRERLGTKRMQMPRTTFRGWSAATRIEIYQRYTYEFKRSHVPSEAYLAPYVSDRPAFPVEIEVDTPASAAFTLLPHGTPVVIPQNSLQGTRPFKVSSNMEGTAPISPILQLTSQQDGATVSIPLTEGPPGTFTGTYTFDGTSDIQPAENDQLFATLVVNGVPFVTPFTIGPTVLP